jgi:hypothetical protein
MPLGRRLSFCCWGTSWVRGRGLKNTPQHRLPAPRPSTTAVRQGPAVWPRPHEKYSTGPGSATEPPAMLLPALHLTLRTGIRPEGPLVCSTPHTTACVVDGWANPDGSGERPCATHLVEWLPSSASVATERQQLGSLLSASLSVASTWKSELLVSVLLFEAR